MEEMWAEKAIVQI